LIHSFDNNSGKSSVSQVWSQALRAENLEPGLTTGVTVKVFKKGERCNGSKECENLSDNEGSGAHEPGCEVKIEKHDENRNIFEIPSWEFEGSVVD
jgi:hypothetical protein